MAQSEVSKDELPINGVDLYLSTLPQAHPACVGEDEKIEFISISKSLFCAAAGNTLVELCKR